MNWPTAEELWATAIISGLYLLAFGLAFAMRNLFPNRKELSRKTVHLLGGLISLSFPFYIHNWILPAILCTVFLLAMTLTRSAKWMEMVHGIDRDSLGAFLFPVAVFLMYILAADKPAFYVVGILVLALSDTVAALVGKRYGIVKFELEENIKSLEGTFSFTVVTYIAIQTPLLLMTSMEPLQIILISLVAAWIVTGFELISLWGSDNLFIPLGTYYIVERMSGYSLAVNWESVLWLVLAPTLTWLIFGWIKTLKVSYKITLAMFNFATLALVGNLWPIPALLFQILLGVSAWYYIKKNGQAPFQVKYVLYLSAIPTILMFTAAAMSDVRSLLPAFIMALSCQGAWLSFDLFFPKTTKDCFRKFHWKALWALGSFALIALFPVALILGWEALLPVALGCSVAFGLQEILIRIPTLSRFPALTRNTSVVAGLVPIILPLFFAGVQL